MNPHHPSEDEIFERASQLSVEARAAYLTEATGGDEQLRQRIEKLLQAHAQADPSFMGQPAASAKTIVVNTGMIAITEKTGDRIGHYKLLEQIGEGGFGEVWMAEQEQPVRRRVALKIIKLGMDTKEVVARFEAERQALALMDHPGIAKVFDGGATESGRPYFVMELVRGEPITKYCDEQRLSTLDRLELFAQVCQAVQHAHQKGIIHRDLKPSNILVTELDGKAVPKVIDFGVAKATEARLTEKTLFTRLGQMIGTPGYMSPEQASQGGLDIDTRTDIYSLGVVLYELLTGRTPFDPKKLWEAGWEAMVKTIREVEPPPPSTKLSTLSPEELSAIAQQRRVEPAKLNRLVRGELDWIVLKALEKDRGRRYESASAFAHDIQRHLSHEPVIAAKPSASYKFRKFARRHKVAFATATAFAALLLAGVIVSTSQAVRATRAEKVSNKEASKSRQVAQFLKDMLNGVGPSVARGRDTAMLREILDKTIERVGKDLKDQPDVEAELRMTMGEVYWTLGDQGKAETMYGTALIILRKLRGNEHPDVANAVDSLGVVLIYQGKFAEAEALVREALAINKKLGDERLVESSVLNNLASVLSMQGKLAEAEISHRQLLEMQRKHWGNEHPKVITTLNNLGNALREQVKLTEAELIFREALAMSRKLLGNENPNTTFLLGNLANVLRDQGKLTEAEAILHEALETQRRVLGKEHQDVATSVNNLANVLRDQGKLAEAEGLYREALATYKKRLGSEHPNVATMLNNLASA